MVMGYTSFLNLCNLEKSMKIYTEERKNVDGGNYCWVMLYEMNFSTQEMAQSQQGIKQYICYVM